MAANVSVHVRVDDEDFVEMQAERVQKLGERMMAITHKLSTDSTSGVAEVAFREVKADIKIVKKVIGDTLRERSRKARGKTGHKAEDKALQHDVVCQRWYEWVRTSKCQNIDKESKRLVTPERARVEDMLRNISLSAGLSM